MNAPVIARKIHKWLTLVIGIQVLFWMLSGAYMAVVDIDFIHGDSLVRNTTEGLPEDIDNLYPMSDVIGRYPAATSVDLVAREGTPMFVVAGPSRATLLDAKTGEAISPLTRDRVMSLASHYYAADGSLVSVVLLTDDSARPKEIQMRPLPLWQAVFDDRIATTFYISPTTGELVSRRHSFWRVYDFLWMFHIMDYENRSDINNNLLRVAAAIGLFTALSGIWLLVHSLRGSKRRARLTQPATESSEFFNDSIPKTS